MPFVNRVKEIATLDDWWARPGSQLGIVWGRRRVGKSYLINHWAKDKRSIFHVARNRPLAQELAALSAAAAPVLSGGRRDLLSRPFVSWDDVFDTLADAAARQPLLLTIDEVPELLISYPTMASGLRAIWERMADTKLRLLLCGSAVPPWRSSSMSGRRSTAAPHSGCAYSPSPRTKAP